jgi:hypothetical protein
MKSTNNPLCTCSSGNGPLNNHKLVNSFLLGLIWVEMHSGLKTCSIVVGVNDLHVHGSPCVAQSLFPIFFQGGIVVNEIMCGDGL